MKFTLLIVIVCITSCGSPSSSDEGSFNRFLPNTKQTWAGQMTKSAFEATRKIETSFRLASMSNGLQTTELRLWMIAHSFDPQGLTILHQADDNTWQLRTIRYSLNNDSIWSDRITEVPASLIGSLNLDRIWNLTSQGDMKDGDTYGCLDGSDMILEIADYRRYKYVWYRCPDINQSKDTNFFQVNQLSENLSRINPKTN